MIVVTADLQRLQLIWSFLTDSDNKGSKNGNEVGLLQVLDKT